MTEYRWVNLRFPLEGEGGGPESPGYEGAALRLSALADEGWEPIAFWAFGYECWLKRTTSGPSRFVDPDSNQK